MKKINTIILCGIAYPWLNALKTLKYYLNIEPVYYIAWRNDLLEEELKKHFPDCYYQTVEDAWKGKGFPKVDKYPLDEKLLKSIAHEQLIFLKMLDRLDPDGHAFSFTFRQYFFQDLLENWLRIIEEKNISLIISPTIPHRNFDFALYIASKILGIEFIMFQWTPFEDSSFIIDSTNQTPDYLKEAIMINTPSLPLRQDIESRIQSVKSTYDNARPSYMKEQEEITKGFNYKKSVITPFIHLLLNPSQLVREVNTYRVVKGFMPSDSKTYRFQQIIKNHNWKKYKEHLKKYYENICVTEINNEYILVALVYQPEETSCPTGGSYTDQILIIKLLDAFLDNKIDIVVKEHKTQFYRLGEGESGRDEYFYKRIMGISSRVKLVSIYEDPFKLIDGALATVTISGTIGWESIIRGTPAIIFGRAWYEDMPGVYKVKSYEDLRLIWPEVIKIKNNISQKKIVNYHRILQNFFINAPHYKGYISPFERSPEENANNLYIGIKNHLIQKGWKFDFDERNGSTL